MLDGAPQMSIPPAPRADCGRFPVAIGAPALEVQSSNHTLFDEGSQKMRMSRAPRRHDRTDRLARRLVRRSHALLGWRRSASIRSGLSGRLKSDLRDVLEAQHRAFEVDADTILAQELVSDD